MFAWNIQANEMPATTLDRVTTGNGGDLLDDSRHERVDCPRTKEFPYLDPGPVLPRSEPVVFDKRPLLRVCLHGPE